MRVAVAGADKTPDSLREGFMQKHGLELCEGYGTTETSPVVSTNLPGANKPGSIGKVLPSVRVKIVDINTGEALPPGGEGKILVKGDLVMKGYFDDLEETSLRIKDGWYETGDMGLIDEEGLRVIEKTAGQGVRQVRRIQDFMGEGDTLRESESEDLIDVIEEDPAWSGWSQSALDEWGRRGPVCIGPVVYAELSGAQHAWDIFRSVRAMESVHAVARFLEWARATTNRGR